MFLELLNLIFFELNFFLEFLNLIAFELILLILFIYLQSQICVGLGKFFNRFRKLFFFCEKKIYISIFFLLPKLFTGGGYLVLQTLLYCGQRARVGKYLLKAKMYSGQQSAVGNNVQWAKIRSRQNSAAG